MLQLFKHPLFLKLAAKFGKADRIEHCGYLCVMALVEHSLLRLVALVILVGVVIAVWIANE